MSDARFKSVIVPLAGDGGSVGEIEAWEQSSELELRGAHPALVELFETPAMYEAAEQAYECVRRLPYKRFGHRLTRHSPSREMTLKLASEREFAQVPAGSGRSAELGAALAMLMLERRSPHAVVAATGALERAVEDKLDAEIKPVGGLTEKLNALGRHLERSKGALGKRFIVLVPKTTLDNRPLLEAHQSDIDALKDVGESVGITVDVKAVGLLSEAAQEVGALKPPINFKAIGGALAGVAATLLVLATLVWAAHDPVMRFAPVLVGDASITTPVRSVYDRRLNRIYPAPACVTSDGTQHVPLGEGLTILVEVDGDFLGPLRAPVWMHDFMLISVGEESLVKVYPAAALDPAGRPVYHDGRIRFGARLTIEAPAEEMKLFVLARRRIPLIGGRFDAGVIKFELEGAIQNTPADARINQAMAYVDSLPGARLEVGFEAVEGALGQAVVDDQGEFQTTCDFKD